MTSIKKTSAQNILNILSSLENMTVNFEEKNILDTAIREFQFLAHQLNQQEIEAIPKDITRDTMYLAIPAIKLYRARTGFDLKQSKDAVDKYIKDNLS